MRTEFSGEHAASPLPVSVGRRLRHVREECGLSQLDVARRLNKTQTAVSYWEGGRRMPSLTDLLQLADVFECSVSDLIPSGSAQVPVEALLRATIGKLNHERLTEDLQGFLDAASRLPRLERELSTSAEHPIRAAQELLSRAGVTDAPPVDVHRLANRCGARVLVWSFDDALSGLVVELETGPVLGVNSGHPPVRQRFTVAHEIGHHLLGHRDRFYLDLSANPQDGDPPEYQSRHERDANEFAANVLMPAALVRAEHSKTPDAVTLASAFGVSDLAMRYRLATLGLR